MRAYSYAVMIGAASVEDYLWRFFVPTLLGNMIGGISLVAIINHGSIAAEIQSPGNTVDGKPNAAPTQ